MLAALLAGLLTGCGPGGAHSDAAATTPDAAQPELGLMTSLPLYWPLGAQLSEIASGTATAPWQRAALAERHRLVLLDTLSPIAAVTAGEPESDPLAGLTRLAIIQPRGLSPADNVALDDWVQAGGRVLMVLDPQLTGEYDVALGDPRRPSDVALIPPVLARWGLAIRFDDAQPLAVRRVTLGKGSIPLVLAGEVALSAAAREGCTLVAEGAAARCRVGKGQVTLLADAAVFEAEIAGDAERASLAALIAFAFE
ncbi:MAG: hypothetical protein ACJLS3_14040 [Erythrobacter sp.]